jgi:hypothetical protein
VTDNIAKWDCFELTLNGPPGGNPYLDVSLSATFSLANRAITVPGFYDGGGTYRVRFMPDTEGEWRYRTQSTADELDGRSGSLICRSPRDGVHGPVRVANRHHFAYADGTPYLPFGTTCYAWTHQPLALQEKTLETLARTRFNKLRMCVFPKDYIYNINEPLHDAFLRKSDGSFDFDRPNPEHFHHLDRQVQALGALGIEADIIIFHPYDRWGFSDMPAEQDFRYVAYLAARLSAYRNVWWSLANEYDFMLDTKPMEQWDRFFHILEENDHVRHLRSIHNGDVTMNYDHRKPWVDHVCIQNWDVKRTQEWRETYGKPVVNDEPEYEGNIYQSWGSITAEELVHRYWITLLRGGYAGHGETYQHPEDILWWAKGGVLHGEAWKRIGFLRDILEADVRHGLEPLAAAGAWPWSRVSGARDGKTTLIYFGEHQPTEWALGLPQHDNYIVDLIDTWAMTVTPLEKTEPPRHHPTRHGAIVRGQKPDAPQGVKLPGRPYLALRVREAE